jgi:DNA-binding GntR family transcriptional regulator
MSTDLETGHALIDRSSTGEKAADILRTRIIRGRYRPGSRLVDTDLALEFGVSRNIVREAFRLLSHERLVVQEFNRGVFVRIPSVGDVADIYRVRRIVECQAVRGLRRGNVPEAIVAELDECLALADQALAEGDWLALGTANMQFHELLAGLAGSERIDELMRRLLAELRLVFHKVDDPRGLHEPYVARNAELFELIRSGRGDKAERYLTAYLDHAQRQLLDAYAVEEKP